MRGRTAASQANFSSPDDVCGGLTGGLASALAAPGSGGSGPGALVVAVRAAAAELGLASLASTGLNATASAPPDGCTTPHVPLPTPLPTPPPSPLPTSLPSELPTALPTQLPTALPTELPTEGPTQLPTQLPTALPTALPTELPTALPTEAPTPLPTDAPTALPTDAPTPAPTPAPTEVLRGYQQCVCVTAGVAAKLKSWCPEVAPHFDGESCLSNVTATELADLLVDCPHLQTSFAL